MLPPPRPLKTLLLNQDFLAGVGNIYADEALWRARLHPLRDAHTLGGTSARRLHRRCATCWPKRSSGAAARSTTTPRPRATARCRSTWQVYQRAGEPCDRCGRPIRRIVVGGRSTHFCSWCQRLPAEQRAGRRPRLRAGRRLRLPDPPRPALDGAVRRRRPRPHRGRGLSASRARAAASPRRPQGRGRSPRRRRAGGPA
jgi:hypothetical protein